MSPLTPSSCATPYRETIYGNGIHTNAEGLRADTPNWAKVGRALENGAQDGTGLAERMSDWASHPDAKPSHLIPLVRAYRCLERIEP